MSAFFYNSRLYFEGYHGVAKHDGVLVTLNRCPQITPGERLVCVDYAPEVHVATVQAFNAPHRDMTPAEAGYCHGLLERMAINAREALNGS